ncbi:hypothetical protein [Actinomadura luzonensis]|uniref:hypothetical protein n=1 Tax=Actinomadura luzonensis TaxID=2805427 RepID=UPI002675748B|nr:hypothetical protein [Actinomadura luzonensis]
MVLPDHERAPAVAAALRTPTARTLTHASGRPWLVGHWLDEELTVAAAGPTRLAVIGRCPIGAARLAAEAARLHDLDRLDHLDRLARTLPGSFHLVAAHDGRIRALGTASGLRLVFHARLAGLTVTADRADVLAAGHADILAADRPGAPSAADPAGMPVPAAGAEVEPRRLAARLLWPVPHPLHHLPLWPGVTAVPPGHHVTVEAGGAVRHGRWWSRPSRCARWPRPPPTCGGRSTRRSPSAPGRAAP